MKDSLICWWEILMNLISMSGNLFTIKIMLVRISKKSENENDEFIYNYKIIL